MFVKYYHFLFDVKYLRTFHYFILIILQPGEFIHTLGDSHVYLNHEEALREQLQREPRPFPTLHIRRQVSNIEDFTVDDFVLTGYNPHPKLSMPMAV